MSNNESKIVVKPSEHAPLEPQILRNVEQAIIARHTTKCSFEHLEEVMKVAEREILKDFKQQLSEIVLPAAIATEPMTLTVSLWRKKKLLTQKSEKQEYVFELAAEDTAAELLKKLHRLLYALKKPHANGKADTIMIAFEWLECVDSAAARDVARLVAKKVAEVTN